MIHELVVRFNATNIHTDMDLGNITFVKSYENVHSFNLTSYEDGTQAMNDYMNQQAVFSRNSPPTAFSCVPYFPFLLLFVYPSDFGETIVLNLDTGKIMLAASSVWMGTGTLVYPESVAALGRPG